MCRHDFPSTSDTLGHPEPPGMAGEHGRTMEMTEGSKSVSSLESSSRKAPLVQFDDNVLEKWCIDCKNMKDNKNVLTS